MLGTGGIFLHSLGERPKNYLTGFYVMREPKVGYTGH